MEAALKIRLRLAVSAVALAAACVLGVALQPKVELSASGMGPLLPVQAQMGELSFLSSAMRDTEALRHKPEDDQDATRLATEIKEFRADLARSKGERALELNEQAYQGYAALAYFLEDKASPASRQNLEAVRGFIVQHAAAAAKLTKNESARARALFHMYAASYHLGRDRSGALKGMRELAKGNKLPGSVKRAADVMIALADLDSGNEAAKREARKDLAAAGKALPGAAGVAARLHAARGLAGLTRDGRKSGRVDPSYRSQLAAASSKAASLSPQQKEETLAYMIAVWRKAEGGNADWDKVPFKMAAFSSSLAVKGIVERSALADWSKGDSARAIKKYEGLATSLTGDARRADLDLRVLDMRRAEAAKAKNPKAYEAALIAKNKAYLDPGLLGEKNVDKVKQMLAEIARRHGALVHGEMARVANKSSSNGERARAIGMAHTYLATIDDAKEIESVKGKVANLYVVGGQHREAVAAYKELAETGSDARKYTGLAIISQTHLAHWSLEAPWAGVQAGDDQDRGELLALYQKYQQLSGNKADWSIIAHVGLLQTTLGQTEQAFAMWTATLKANPQGGHAANAAGYMIVAYRKASAWDNLEAMSRLCLAQRVAPMHKGQRISPTEQLALALLEGGKQAFEAQQFAVAVKKLKEFVAQHGGHQRHDEGMMFLANAYHGNSQHKESVSTLLTFVERHPSSKFMRQALLQGGDWSAPMAYEENAMFFYAKFLKDFTKDAEGDRVRATVIELYVGRGLYSEAVAALWGLVNSPALGAPEKSQALAQILDIEERQGSAARADKAAQMLVSASDAQPEHKAEAYAFLARQAARKSDYQRVRQIEATLAAMNSSAFAVQDAQGEARYLLAMSAGRTAVKEHFNLELKDPAATIAQRFAEYKKIRATFDNVCAVGDTSFCAPAMHELARLSQEFMRSIEDIDVQSTLAKEVVARFNSQKQAVYNEVAKTSQRADNKALAVVRRGYTDPDATQAVLWQNTSDWNSDRVSGETGNAYVQWSTRQAADTSEEAE